AARTPRTHVRGLLPAARRLREPTPWAGGFGRPSRGPSSRPRAAAATRKPTAGVARWPAGRLAPTLRGCGSLIRPHFCFPGGERESLLGWNPLRPGGVLQPFQEAAAHRMGEIVEQVGREHPLEMLPGAVAIAFGQPDQTDHVLATHHRIATVRRLQKFV